MDIVEKNEKKQYIKTEIYDLLDKNIPNILKKYGIPEDKVILILKDLLVWANMVLDSDLN